MTTVAVTGATGEMGQAVLALAEAREDIDVALAITRQPPEAVTRNVRVTSPSDLPDALGNEVDVLIDFTVPDAAVEAVTAAADAGIATVVGTTGFDDAQLAELGRAAEEVPVLLAPNFSRGIQALIGALEATLARLTTYDIEVTETHHHRKRDAPSGTANRLLETIESHRAETSIVHGREGETTRSDTEVGVHSRRAGSITGEHEILLAGNDEEIRLVHRAESRDVFAAGALDAAAWLDGKPSGWYRFAEVVET